MIVTIPGTVIGLKRFVGAVIAEGLRPREARHWPRGLRLYREAIQSVSLPVNRRTVLTFRHTRTVKKLDTTRRLVYLG